MQGKLVAVFFASEKLPSTSQSTYHALSSPPATTLRTVRVSLNYAARLAVLAITLHAIANGAKNTAGTKSSPKSSDTRLLIPYERTVP